MVKQETLLNQGYGACIPENIPPLVGRRELSVVKAINDTNHRFLEMLNNAISQSLAESISFKMHNNSAYGLGSERPVSAYFTLIPKKWPNKERLLIEWGQICPDGNAKLHNYLNGHINHQQRIKDGAIIRSGHIGPLYIPTIKQAFEFALLDALAKDLMVKRNSPNFKIIASLLSKRIAVVTSDGYPVRVEI